MRLRNKKTGETINGGFVVCEYKDGARFSVKDKPCFDSLTELNENWEDYEPIEPLIKDKKIRKAVRAWAEANDVKKVTIEKDFSTYAFYPTDTDRVSISVWTEPSLSNLSRGKIYDIAELCGEEQE